MHHWKRRPGFQMCLRLEKQCKCGVKVDCKYMKFVAQDGAQGSGGGSIEL